MGVNNYTVGYSHDISLSLHRSTALVTQGVFSKTILNHSFNGNLLRYFRLKLWCLDSITGISPVSLPRNNGLSPYKCCYIMPRYRLCSTRSNCFNATLLRVTTNNCCIFYLCNSFHVMSLVAYTPISPLKLRKLTIHTKGHKADLPPSPLATLISWWGQHS